MSADNGIFILDHPRGFAVVHHRLSCMPYDIYEIFHQGKTTYDELLYIFSGKDAYARASSQARELAKKQYILEYGIVDWRNPERDYRPELHTNLVIDKKIKL